MQTQTKSYLNNSCEFVDVSLQILIFSLPVNNTGPEKALHEWWAGVTGEARCDGSVLVCVFSVCWDISLMLEVGRAIMTAMKNKPRCEKTGLRGFRLGPTQTRLYNHTRWIEA